MILSSNNCKATAKDFKVFMSTKLGKSRRRLRNCILNISLRKRGYKSSSNLYIRSIKRRKMKLSLWILRWKRTKKLLTMLGKSTRSYWLTTWKKLERYRIIIKRTLKSVAPHSRTSTSLTWPIFWISMRKGHSLSNPKSKKFRRIINQRNQK